MKSVTVYVTASNRWSAMFFADYLAGQGFSVLSCWHDEEMKRSSELTDAEKIAIADAARQTIIKSDFLIEIADPDMVPGGKFVDVGIALGAGKTVIVVGRRENIKMYDPSVIVVSDHMGVAKVIRDQSAVQPPAV